jgi:hypothetical protein
MEAVGIFYGHFVNFPAVWYILWKFGMISPVFVAPRKIWQHWN